MEGDPLIKVVGDEKEHFSLLSPIFFVNNKKNFFFTFCFVFSNKNVKNKKQIKG